MIKGHVTIDIHNHNSGFTERIEQDNLVTDAVGILASVYAGANMTDKIMPLATKALGGLMLFDGALAEEKSNIFFPSNAHLTGFAGQWVNTSNPFCGSLNVQETHATDTGYETVWDFSTSQANGTIASLALTAAPESDKSGNPFTGINGNMQIHNANTNSSEVKQVTHSVDQIMYSLKDNGRTQEYDESRKIYTTKAGITVEKSYMPIRKYKVADWVNRADVREKLKDIELTVESVRGNIFETESRKSSEFILNGYDGYAYMFYSNGNNEGDGSFSYQRIKISDFSFDVEDPVKVILPGTKLEGRIFGGEICKGKCFLAGKDERYIYIVDLANTADVKTADMGEGQFFYYNYRFMADPGGTMHVKIAKRKDANRYEISDAIIYPDGVVRINIPYKEETDYEFNRTINNMEYSLGTESLVAYKNWIGNPMMNYLGTICNLTTPVTKTAASSMKITYTLTDEVQI